MRWFSNDAQVAVLLVSGGLLLAGFYWLLGDISFGETYPIYVDFDDPGILQLGAAVRAGGLEIGHVERIEYRGRRLDPLTRRHPIVRLRLAIDRDSRVTLHENAVFTTTSLGVLGARFVDVDPGDPERPQLEEGAIVEGVDGPRLDLALAHTYELLETVTDGMRDNRDELRAMFDDLVALESALSTLESRGDDLDAILEDSRALGDEVAATVASARRAYIDGEQARRVRRNLDTIQSNLDRDVPAIVGRAEEIARSVEELEDTFGPEQRRRIEATTAAISRIAERAETAADESEEIMSHVEEGRGTVGAFRLDPEINDDVIGLYRLILGNPWRLFWRD